MIILKIGRIKNGKWDWIKDYVWGIKYCVNYVMVCNVMGFRWKWNGIR